MKKKCSFNFIVSFATVGALLGVMGLQAGHRHHSSSHKHHSSSHKHHSSSTELREGKYCLNDTILEEKKDVVISDLETISGSLNTIFAVEGTTDNPDPTTNDLLAGTIASETVIINSSIDEYVQILRSLGVKKGKRQAIETANSEWVDAALAYSLSVNLWNTGDATQTQEVQDALAATFLAAGTTWGTLLANEASDTKILKDIQTLTVNLTELVQARRGVLNAVNKWGADPADPESEAVAATAIDAANHAIAKRIGARLVYGVNHEKCGS